MLDEVPPPSRRPPGVVYALRAIGVAGMTLVVIATIHNEPRPSLHGNGVLVLLALIGLVVGIAASLRRGVQRPGARAAALLLVAVSGIVLAATQRHGAAIGAVYYVFAIAELRLPRRTATVLSVIAIGGQAIAVELAGGDMDALGVIFSTVPFWLIIRLLRELRDRNDRAQELVEELRESRAAHAQAAALGERARLARDMHDVLAHSLSALALKLEATRLLAADRGSDPEVVDAVEQAHRLAASGIDEARRVIAALRGDELPGPERLQALADAFAEHSTATCTVTVTGTPRELGSEARLALYRTAQEALTNIRRHSAAQRVEIRLDWSDDGAMLTVQDYGPGAPVAVGAGSGYGLTGMRERAELLGGRLAAEPTDDGFRVALWLPA